MSDTSVYPIMTCPYCGSIRAKQYLGSNITLSYFPEIICKWGYNINPDNNEKTSQWNCIDCNKTFNTTNSRHTHPCEVCIEEHCIDRKFNKKDK
jgi:hypothetical protein